VQEMLFQLAVPIPLDLLKSEQALLSQLLLQRLTFVGHNSREFCLQWKQKGAKSQGKGDA